MHASRVPGQARQAPSALRCTHRNAPHVYTRANADNGGAADLRKKVEAAMSEDPKAREAIERIAAAADKVEAVKQRRQELEEEERASRAAQRSKQASAEKSMQAALAKSVELEQQAAQNQLEAAQLEKELLRAETAQLRGQLSQDAERIESGKTAAVAAAGGLLGLVPSVVTSTAAPLAQAASVATGLATCVLFGVVYRYVIAADAANVQLRGGAVGAFGLTRGLPLAQSALLASERLDAESLASAALLAGQSMLLVGFAAAAIELGLKQGFLVPFGSAGVDDASA